VAAAEAGAEAVRLILAPALVVRVPLWHYDVVPALFRKAARGYPQHENKPHRRLRARHKGARMTDK